MGKIVLGRPSRRPSRRLPPPCSIGELRLDRAGGSTWQSTWPPRFSCERQREKKGMRETEGRYGEGRRRSSPIFLLLSSSSFLPSLCLALCFFFLSLFLSPGFWGESRRSEVNRKRDVFVWSACCKVWRGSEGSAVERGNFSVGAGMHLWKMRPVALFPSIGVSTHGAFECACRL